MTDRPATVTEYEAVGQPDRRLVALDVRLEIALRIGVAGQRRAMDDATIQWAGPCACDRQPRGWVRPRTGRARQTPWPGPRASAQAPHTRGALIPGERPVVVGVDTRVQPDQLAPTQHPPDVVRPREALIDPGGCQRRPGGGSARRRRAGRLGVFQGSATPPTCRPGGVWRRLGVDQCFPSSQLHQLPPRHDTGLHPIQEVVELVQVQVRLVHARSMWRYGGVKTPATPPVDRGRAAPRCWNPALGSGTSTSVRRWRRRCT
jgi:hypothetical protein